MKVEDIRKDITRGVQAAVRETKEEVMNIIAKLMIVFYAEYPPSLYFRTGQLLNTIVDNGVKSRANGSGFEIYFDSGMMGHPNPAYDKYGKSHEAKWSEDRILEFVMEGGDNGAPHGGYGLAGGDPIWFKLIEELSDLDIIIYAALLKAGVPVH